MVFLDTGADSGLTADQRAAFERYYGRGGGFFGIGSAIETDPSWQFLTDVLGTRATATAAGAQAATIVVADRVHEASSETFPEYWDRADVYYNFAANVRGFSHVLATVVEDPFGPQPQGNTLDGISGGTMGADHPVLWCKDYKGGRSFYSALGNTAASLRREPTSAHAQGRDQLDGRRGRPGHQRLRRDRAGELPADHDRAQPERRLEEPIGFDQLPDGRHHPDLAPRHGAPAQPGDRHDPGDRRTSPTRRCRRRCGSTPTRRTASTARPSTTTSPRTSGCTCTTRRRRSRTSSCPTARSSRRRRRTRRVPNFARVADGVGSVRGLLPALALQVRRGRDSGPRLDLSSEQQILRVSNNRQECCHVAGDIDFDKHNNLWMVTGDDTPAGGIRANGYGPFEDELTDEQQTVRITNATGGTFTLTFNGQTTAPLPYNATAAHVDAALEALSNIGANNIQTSGGPRRTPATRQRVLPARAGGDQPAPDHRQRQPA